jgi:hypothetical protein
MLTEQVLRRIFSEFSEMPGLRLTARQAQRLWGLDETTCLQALDELIEAKFLCRTDLDTYSRLTDGPVAWPHVRMAKARMNPLGASTAHMKEAV